MPFVKENERLEHISIGRGSYRNFGGVKTTYNKSGERKFSVFLPEEVALYLENIGWYIKHKDPYRDGDDPQYQLDVGVSYDTKDGKFPPPIITLKTWDGEETELFEDTVCVLDSTDIEDAEMEIRPYNWNVDGKAGCKAYLVELTVTARKPRRALNARLRRDEEEED